MRVPKAVQSGKGSVQLSGWSPDSPALLPSLPTCRCWSRKDRLPAAATLGTRPLPADVRSRGTGSEPAGLPLRAGWGRRRNRIRVRYRGKRKLRREATGLPKPAVGARPLPACLPAPPVLTTAECCCGGIKGEGAVASAAGAGGISAATAAARGADSWGVQLSAPVTTLQPRMLAAGRLGWGGVGAGLQAERVRASRDQCGCSGPGGHPEALQGPLRTLRALEALCKAGGRAGRPRSAPGRAKGGAFPAGVLQRGCQGPGRAVSVVRKARMQGRARPSLWRCCCAAG